MDKSILGEGEEDKKIKLSLPYESFYNTIFFRKSNAGLNLHLHHVKEHINFSGNFSDYSKYACRERTIFSFLILFIVKEYIK